MFNKAEDDFDTDAEETAARLNSISKKKGAMTPKSERFLDMIARKLSFRGSDAAPPVPSADIEQEFEADNLEDQVEEHHHSEQRAQEEDGAGDEAAMDAEIDWAESTANEIAPTSRTPPLKRKRNEQDVYDVPGSISSRAQSSAQSSAPPSPADPPLQQGVRRGRSSKAKAPIMAPKSSLGHNFKISPPITRSKPSANIRATKANSKEKPRPTRETRGTAKAIQTRDASKRTLRPLAKRN